MTHDTLKTWLRQQPFEPFRILMSNGHRYHVRHPENAMLLQTNIIVGEPGTDRYAELALLHVAGVERLETNAAGVN